ncbi:MAG: hypothetical protein GOVbin2937_17 [Prokaryotic dsDNA virus sp.]|nr:MAG: hypothetical protein GOVbin2937_17 [Prokaryotic dsDNA virus sp.]|tara:strand:- start:8100 stop:8297 length:198 start_codon:yes stop_codon:yes gene_type:complete
MTRVVVVVVILCAVGGWLYWLGGKEAREDLREQIQHTDTLERMSDAPSDDRSPNAINDRLRDLSK